MGDFDKTFARHEPSSAGFERLGRVRAGYTALKALLEQACPPSRERAVAVTELETSAMWATKSIVVNDPGSEVIAPGSEVPA